MTKYEKTDDPNFIKCKTNNLVINTNDQAYKAYVAERKRFVELSKSVEQVEYLKMELEHLKQVVNHLLKKEDKNGISSL